VVVNLESTIKSIGEAVEETEQMSGTEVHSVFAGIAGGHVKGLNSRGVIAVSREDREITKADLERVIDAAKAVAIPMDREVIHILPQEYLIDGQNGIKEPVGMSGIRLEAEIHLVTGAVTSAQNIVRSVNRAGFKVEDIVLQPLAASKAVLTSDEKDLGVVLIDIGGGTTDIVIFVEGSIWHTEILALGGNHVTDDIAIGLQTPTPKAEEIKKRYGCALISKVSNEEMIEIPSVGGRGSRHLPRRVLAEIIEPRMEEIFSLANEEIKRTGYQDSIAAGVVLTGGASLTEGVLELAEEVFQVPVRIGLPLGINGLSDLVNSPIYATGVGLVLYGIKDYREGRVSRFSERNLFQKVKERMKEWFEEFF
jgi:cell division protein FtsA